MKKLQLFIIPILLLAISGSNLTGNLPLAKASLKVETRQMDNRARVLSEYFALHNSPLQYQAQDFIDAADKNGLDWKLVAAISGVESTFGKASYGYNAWGWGIYGDNRLGFSSWKDGINTVSAGLKTGYIDKGLTDPYSINKVYAASPTWGSRVNFFMNSLDEYASKTEPKAATINPLIKTAGSSAQLAYKSI